VLQGHRGLQQSSNSFNSQPFYFIYAIVLIDFKNIHLFLLSQFYRAKKDSIDYFGTESGKTFIAVMMIAA
jgi:hypothetical protein